MRKVLVTGGAGFIGSHIVESFVSEGWEVTVLDNFSTGHIDNLGSVQERITIIEGDIRNQKVVDTAIEGASVVIHLAALASVPASFNNPLETYDVNFTGTQIVLDSARRHGVERFAFASSSAVYGDTEQLPITEKNEDNPLSPYGVSKLLGEKLCRFYFTAYGLKTVIFRFFNAYGPRQNPYSEYSAVIPKFLSLISEGNTPTIFGDGEQTRDFIFIEDLVKAHHLALEAENGFGQPLNLGSGERTSLNELLAMISKQLGKAINVNYTAPRKGDIIHSYCNINLVKELLSFSPSHNMYDGLEKMIKFYNLN
ncbi:MAG: SDR family NAD(P)-dependent oxidoreductase [Ignavibacteriaceae bacterium]|nr:SDR family NAD(P)-dependent oxidoreductase [Ignavibacteriaceae bacterium]